MAAAERYDTYDSFASFYRRDWGADFHREARPALESLAFQSLSSRSRVLDLCCGTGDLSKVLFERGYVVTGIDGSAEMLRIARQRLPEIEFRLGDARSFRLPPTYDAAISTFDSLNHILTLPELEAVFSNVFAALRQSAFFVFDLNMDEAFLSLWHGSAATVEEESVCITRGSYDAEEKLGRADVTMFLRNNDCWERRDITVFERSYEEDEVVSGLRHAGFGEICARDGWELGMRGDIALGRKFFLARKI